MKFTIKYFLNVIGIALMVIGPTCEFSIGVKSILYSIGFIIYASKCLWSEDDEAKQEKQIKKLEEKVEELENKLSKTDDKIAVNLEDVPMNYDEYLDRVSDKYNGKTL